MHISVSVLAHKVNFALCMCWTDTKNVCTFVCWYTKRFDLHIEMRVVL